MREEVIIIKGLDEVVRKLLAEYLNRYSHLLNVIGKRKLVNFFSDMDGEVNKKDFYFIFYYFCCVSKYEGQDPLKINPSDILDIYNETSNVEKDIEYVKTLINILFGYYLEKEYPDCVQANSSEGLKIFNDLIIEAKNKCDKYIFEEFQIRLLEI